MKITEKMIRNVSKIIIEQTFDIGFKTVNEYVIGEHCNCLTFDKLDDGWKLKFQNVTKNFTLGSIAEHIENVTKLCVPYKISIIGK